MYYPERPQSKNPELSTHLTEQATHEQLMLLFAQADALYQLAQDPSVHVTASSEITYNPAANEAVYKWGISSSGNTYRQMLITPDGPGYIFEYRAKTNRLIAVRGITVKADGMNSKSESGVFEEDHFGLFWEPEIVERAKYHNQGVPLNYADVAQDFIDDFWASTKVLPASA